MLNMRIVKQRLKRELIGSSCVEFVYLMLLPMVIYKMMAKVDRTGGAFYDSPRHAATMVVVMSGLGYSLHR
jgi:hypothetical protein